jgi:undecaprenyl-diphosphatase
MIESLHRKRLLATAAACTALFAVLATAVVSRWSPLLRLDDNGVQAAHAATTKAYRSFLNAWGNAVSPANLVWAGLLLTAFLLVRRRWRQAAVTAALTVGGNYLVEALKSAFGRPRPNLQHTLARSTGYSFPSHHALMSTLVGGLLVLAVLPELRTPQRWVPGALTAAVGAVAVFTAYSRVALAKHFPSDVVAGCALGLALVLAAALLVRPAGRQLPPADGPRGVPPREGREHVR